MLVGVNKRGQAAFEYMLLFGLIALVVIGMLAYSSSSLSKSLTMTMGERAINYISSSVDEVYSLGPGSQKIINVEFPKRVRSVTLNGNYVGLVLRGKNTDTVFAKQVLGNITSDFNYTNSSRMTIVMDELGEVIIR